MNVLDEIVADQIRTDLPELASGDTVKVSAKVVEGGKERIQVFEGTVMRLRGGGIARSITVRKIASGVGVERTSWSTARGSRRSRSSATASPPRPALLTPRSRRQGRDPSRAPNPELARYSRSKPGPRRRAAAETEPGGHAGYPEHPMAVRVPSLRYENVHWRNGAVRVVGIDEVGVAPTCGAVVAAAVIMKPHVRRIPGVRDSKTLSAAQRERLAPIIRRRAVAIGVGAASVREIDTINIYHATHLAMRRAVARPRA